MLMTTEEKFGGVVENEAKSSLVVSLINIFQKMMTKKKRIITKRRSGTRTVNIQDVTAVKN